VEVGAAEDEDVLAEVQLVDDPAEVQVPTHAGLRIEVDHAKDRPTILRVAIPIAVVLIVTIPIAAVLIVAIPIAVVLIVAIPIAAEETVAVVDAGNLALANLRL